MLVGSVAGETHALPSAILADILRGAGFEVIDLGANTPPVSFAEAARRAHRLIAVLIEPRLEAWTSSSRTPSPPSGPPRRGCRFWWGAPP